MKTMKRFPKEWFTQSLERPATSVLTYAELYALHLLRREAPPLEAPTVGQVAWWIGELGDPTRNETPKSLYAVSAGLKRLERLTPEESGAFLDTLSFPPVECEPWSESLFKQRGWGLTREGGIGCRSFRVMFHLEPYGSRRCDALSLLHQSVLCFLHQLPFTPLTQQGCADLLHVLGSESQRPRSKPKEPTVNRGLRRLDGAVGVLQNLSLLRTLSRTQPNEPAPAPLT